MKTLFKTFLVLGFLLVAGALLLGWGLIHVLGDVPGVHLSVDGEEVLLSGMGLADAFGAGIGLVVWLLVRDKPRKARRGQTDQPGQPGPGAAGMTSPAAEPSLHA